MDNGEDGHQLNYGGTDEDYDESEDRHSDGEGDVGMDDSLVGASGHTPDLSQSSSGLEDNELEAIKVRVREMEEEAEKLRQLTHEVDLQMNTPVPTSPTGSAPAPAPNLSIEEKMEVDARSVYCGNVDYQATAEELENHFHGCGSINRVTILCNKHDGHPKGFAYIEFADRESVNTAMAMDDSLFRGRQIKVMPKRTNRPGLGVSRGGTSPRGASRGFRGGYRGRGFFRGGYSRYPRRGGYRGRGVFYSPY